MTDLSPPPRPLDSLTERLQARLEHLEARPDLTHPAASRHGRLETVAAPRPDSHDGAAAIDDLNAQLALLRSQLDAADTRAQVASARAANVLAAVDELAAELTRLAALAGRHELRGLRSTVERVRARLHTT